METNQKKSTKELWIELGHLIVLLMIAMTSYLFRSIMKFFVFIASLIKQGIKKIIEWWRDKSTQEKIKSIRRKARILSRQFFRLTLTGCKYLWKGIKKILRFCAKYSLLSIIYTWRGCVWVVTNTVQLIIHLRPTLSRIKDSVKEWKRKADRGRRLNKIRRKRNYEAYQRNGGLRGSLERKSASLKLSIKSYMEEEDDETGNNELTMVEENNNEDETESDYPDTKAQKIGKKIFSSIKGIVEDNN